MALAAEPQAAVPRRADRRPRQRRHARGSPSSSRELKGTLTIVIIEHDMQFLFWLADRDLGDPLGPGDRARHAGRAAGQPWVQASNLGAAQLMLDVAAIDTFYGETQALFGVSLSVRRRRGAGAARRQRRRQDHDAALDPRADAARAAATSASTGATSIAARPRTRSRAPASAGCRTTAALPDADGRAEPRRSRASARASAPGPMSEVTSRSSRALEVPDGARVPRTCRAARCRWWRSARALLGAPGPGAVRRAEPGPGAEDRRRTCMRVDPRA